MLSLTSTYELHRVSDVEGLGWSLCWVVWKICVIFFGPVSTQKLGRHLFYFFPKAFAVLLEKNVSDVENKSQLQLFWKGFQTWYTYGFNLTLYIELYAPTNWTQNFRPTMTGKGLVIRSYVNI